MRRGYGPWTSRGGPEEAALQEERTVATRDSAGRLGTTRHEKRQTAPPHTGTAARRPRLASVALLVVVPPIRNRKARRTDRRGDVSTVEFIDDDDIREEGDADAGRLADPWQVKLLAALWREISKTNKPFFDNTLILMYKGWPIRDINTEDLG